MIFLIFSSEEMFLSLCVIDDIIILDYNEDLKYYLFFDYVKKTFFCCKVITKTGTEFVINLIEFINSINDSSKNISIMMIGEAWSFNSNIKNNICINVNHSIDISESTLITNHYYRNITNHVISKNKEIKLINYLNNENNYFKCLSSFLTYKLSKESMRELFNKYNHDFLIDNNTYPFMKICTTKNITCYGCFKIIKDIELNNFCDFLNSFLVGIEIMRNLHIHFVIDKNDKNPNNKDIIEIKLNNFDEYFLNISKINNYENLKNITKNDLYIQDIFKKFFYKKLDVEFIKILEIKQKIIVKNSDNIFKYEIFKRYIEKLYLNIFDEILSFQESFIRKFRFKYDQKSIRIQNEFNDFFRKNKKINKNIINYYIYKIIEKLIENYVKTYKQFKNKELENYIKNIWTKICKYYEYYYNLYNHIFLISKKEKNKENKEILYTELIKLVIF